MLRAATQLLFVRGTAICSGVVLSTLLARWLQPEGYGVYLFALNIAHLLALPIIAGLPALVMREIGSAREMRDGPKLKGILSWSKRFFIFSAGVLFASANVALLYFANDPETQTLYFFAIVLTVLLACVQLNTSVIIGFQVPVLSNIGDGLVRPLALLVLVVIFGLVLAVSPRIVMALHVCATLLALLWLWAIWRTKVRRDAQWATASDPRYEHRAWVFSLGPLAIITSISVLNTKLDIFLLGVLSTKDEVGMYGLATQMAGLVLLGQTAMLSIVGPRISSDYAASRLVEMENTLRRAALFSFGVAVSVLLAIWLLGPLIIESLIGASFLQSAYVALLLGFGFAASTGLGSVSLCLNMTKNEGMVLKIGAVGLLVNLITNAILIPKFGAIGAAIATITALLLTQFVLYLRVQRILGIAPSFAFPARRSGERHA